MGETGDLFDDLLEGSPALDEKGQRRAEDARRWDEEVVRAAAVPLGRPAAASGLPGPLADADSIQALLHDGAKLGDPYLTAALAQMAGKSPDGRAHPCARCLSILEVGRKASPRWVPREALSCLPKFKIEDGSSLVGRRRYFAALCRECASLDRAKVAAQRAREAQT